MNFRVRARKHPCMMCAQSRRWPPLICRATTCSSNRKRFSQRDRRFSLQVRVVLTWRSHSSIPPSSTGSMVLLATSSSLETWTVLLIRAMLIRMGSPKMMWSRLRTPTRKSASTSHSSRLCSRWQWSTRRTLKTHSWWIQTFKRVHSTKQNHRIQTAIWLK